MGTYFSASATTYIPLKWVWKLAHQFTENRLKYMNLSTSYRSVFHSNRYLSFIFLIQQNISIYVFETHWQSVDLNQFLILFPFQLFLGSFGGWTTGATFFVAWSGMACWLWIASASKYNIFYSDLSSVDMRLS